MKYIKDIIKNDYQEWNKGDNILIFAPTGCGKTTFVKETLKEYCKKNNKKILYLCNRTNLKKQVQADLNKNDDKDNTITVINYQKLESNILRNLNINNYDFVICDEAHYFFTDSSFNIATDLSFKWLVDNNDTVKIFMSATGWTLKSYFKNNNLKFKNTYELEKDYRNIKNTYCFKNDETLEDIIEQIPLDEKIIFFSSNTEKALNISEKFKGAFICSNSNKKYNKYIDVEELDNISKHEKFDKHILCTTIALDNGINIKDDKVKHIIIDIVDRDSFIQCMGRKRIQNKNDKITLYFRDINPNKLKGIKTKIKNTLDRANYLIQYGQVAFVKKSYKNNNFTNLKIIDDVIENDETIKKVNKCMYAKFETDLKLYNLLTKDFKDKKAKAVFSGEKQMFKSVIANQLNIKKEDIVDIEIYEETLSLADTLESIVNKKLFKEEQKQLIDKIDLRVDGKQQRSYTKLNEGLKMLKLPYVILPKKDKKRKLKNGLINPNRDKTYWIVQEK